MQFVILVATQGGDVMDYDDGIDFQPEVQLNAVVDADVGQEVQLDLVQEMEWEDHVEFLTLEEVGLEEGDDDEPMYGQYHGQEGSIYGLMSWYNDGDDEAFSVI